MIFEDRDRGRRTNIEFRPFSRGDGYSFRRCLEDFYGGGYPYREYLEEEFLLEKCNSGNMLILCGITSGGEIVSTSAVRLDEEFKGSALLLLRVVKAAYRGMGIGKVQEEKLFEYVEQQTHLLSVYADVMTHNCVSQGSLARRGFVHCGLRLMLYRNSIMVPGLRLAEEGKMSQAVMCRRGAIQDVGLLHCPAEHAKEVSRIYQQLGAECGIDRDSILPCREKTDISWKKEELHHSCIMMVESAGRDFSKLLHCKMKETDDWNDVTVLCYLNMKDEAAVFAYELLRKAGFFFTGLKPLQIRKEYMLLSHTGRQQIRYQDIHLHEEGADLLSYIHAHQLPES